MSKEFLMLLLIPCTVAQLIPKPIRLITIESLADLKVKLAEAGENLVVIGFLPRSCPHSSKMIPLIEKLAHQYANSVTFLRVYEDHDDIFSEYKVTSVPSFIFVKRTELLTRRTGANIHDLTNMIDTARAEDHILNTVDSPASLKGIGVLYDVECYDDLKARLAEAHDKLVVLCFMPSYCALSYTMIPEVQELAKKHEGTTSFLRLKEEHDDIYEVFGIQEVPTFIFMRDRKKIKVRSGSGINLLTAALEGILSGDYTSTTTSTQKPQSHLMEVTSPKNLNDTLSAAKGKLAVLAFMTKWCSKCKLIDAKLEEIADEYFGNVLFLKVGDENENSEIYNRYGIKRVPTFVFVVNSTKINQYEGTALEKLRTRIELQEFLTF